MPLVHLRTDIPKQILKLFQERLLQYREEISKLWRQSAISKENVQWLLMFRYGTNILQESASALDVLYISSIQIIIYCCIENEIIFPSF